jgi:4-alpha-glucanotransferase
VKLSTEQRRAGLFVPVFALRSKNDLGVGDTKSLMSMIDWCTQSGFSVLQILPINETSGDNSPYNAISANALDITTLHVAPETIPGLSAKKFQELCQPDLLAKLRQGSVAYKAVKKLKWEICQQAFENFGPSATNDQLDAFEKFIEAESSWLADYSLFRALMELNGNVPTWEQWRAEHRTPRKARIWARQLPSDERVALENRELFFSFVQWLLARQWEQVRQHSDKCGVALMGDVPFGISRHGVDVWAQPDDFDLQWSGGAPPEPFFKPDEFTKVWGQNWGIPVYNWEKMKENDYAWWRQRVRQVSRFFHIFRIDHIIGFYRIYTFPWRPEENAAYANLTKAEAEAKAGMLPRYLPNDDETEESRAANCAHGEALMAILQEAAGDSIIIGEDLGMVPIYVRPSLTKLGISGFKIPLFERNEETREYLPPEEYPELSVATLATHDHDTMAGIWASWWRDFELSEKLTKEENGDKELIQKGIYSSWELYRMQRFCRLDDRTLIRDFEPTVREGLCGRMLGGRSWLALLMITDLFGMKIRFNVPGPVAESNWSERLPFNVEDMAKDGHLESLRQFAIGLIKETGRGV